MSNVDPTKPVEGNPTTASVRAQFTTIKAELEAPQSATSATDGANLVAYQHGWSGGAASTGAVARTTQSKLDDWVSVFDFMTQAQIDACESGTEDVTAEIQAAIDSLSATTGGTVYLPHGRFRTTSTITVAKQFVSLVGAGDTNTTILFVPSAADTCVFFGLGGEGGTDGGVLFKCAMKGIRVTSSDTTYKKIGVDLKDVSSFAMEDVTTGARGNWNGQGSIGLRTRGREISTFNRCNFAADNSINIDVNPNFATIHCDHFKFINCYLQSESGYPCVSVSDGVLVSNLTFYGGAWVNGDHGYYHVNTTSPGASHNLLVSSVRFEQPADTDFALTDVNTGTDRITITAHVFANSDPVYFTTTGGLPSGLTASTLYYVKSIDANTIEVYTDAALASIVTLATQGTGTHTIKNGGWFLRIEHGTGSRMTGVLIEDTRGSTEANGIYLRDVDRVTLLDFTYPGAILVAMDFDDCLDLSIVNCFWQTGSIANVGSSYREILSRDSDNTAPLPNTAQYDNSRIAARKNIATGGPIHGFSAVDVQGTGTTAEQRALPINEGTAGVLFVSDTNGSSGAFYLNGASQTATELTAFDISTFYSATKGVTGYNVYHDNTETDTFTADGTTANLTATAHTLIDNMKVVLTTTTTLPDPFALATDYFVIRVDDDTFQLSATLGGAAIVTTDTGTGTHTLTIHSYYIENQRGAVQTFYFQIIGVSA